MNCAASRTFLLSTTQGGGVKNAQLMNNSHCPFSTVIKNLGNCFFLIDRNDEISQLKKRDVQQLRVYMLNLLTYP